ncbi:MAG: GntR family transcriptional regulator [Desertimonas sp.]
MAAIDRGDPLPLWAQLLAILRSRIDAGRYDDGFPTDEQLSAEFELSRHTVRDAVRRLQDEGLLTRRRGVGTTVRRAAIEQPTGVLYSLFRTIESEGHEQRSHVTGRTMTRDPAVAARLDLPAGAELFRLERVRGIDGEAFAHDVVWLPGAVGAALMSSDFRHTGLYDELARTGQPTPDAGGEVILPVVPDAETRRLLGVPARQAVYRIERHSSARGRPLEWRITTMRADRYTIVARWSPGATRDPTLTTAARVW